MPNLYTFFWIASSVDEAAPGNPNGAKTILANIVSIFFTDGKQTGINALRKLRNLPSWLVIFLVVPFKKIPLFSKDLITFLIFSL